MTDPIPRCARGNRCHTREQLERGGAREWVGGPATRPLCDTCERAAAQALDDAPYLYVRLRQATLRPGSGERGEFVKGSPSRPLPGNGRARDLAEQVRWLLCAWEDQVRAIAGLSVQQRVGKREGRQVTDAAKLLSDHLTAWISAAAVLIDTSLWTESLEQTGAQAAAALIDWRHTARNLPGLDTQAPKAVRRYEQRCPGCGVRAVTHRAGDDLMQCQNCGATSVFLPTLPPEADYSDGAGSRPAGPVRATERRRGPARHVAGQDARAGRAHHTWEEEAG